MCMLSVAIIKIADRRYYLQWLWELQYVHKGECSQFGFQVETQPFNLSAGIPEIYYWLSSAIRLKYDYDAQGRLAPIGRGAARAYCRVVACALKVRIWLFLLHWNLSHAETTLNLLLDIQAIQNGVKSIQKQHSKDIYLGCIPLYLLTTYGSMNLYCIVRGFYFRSRAYR